eukprot:gene35987-43645_t
MTNNRLDPPSPPQGSPQDPPGSGGIPGGIALPPIVPRRKDDAVCVNCIGVSFYDDVLKKAGKKPICYGIEYKAGKPIPPDKMNMLDTLPVLQARTKVYAIGMSQSSLRMNRLGQPPIVTMGLQIIMTEKKDQQSLPPKAPIIPPVATQLQEKRESVVSNRMDKALTNVGDTSSLEKSLERYWTLYKKSCNSIFRGMKTLWANPDESAGRLYKGMTKFLDNYQRFLVKTSKSVYKKVFDDGRDSDQGNN